MTIIPDSELHLCSDIEIDNTYEHTIDFDSLEQQLEYFSSKAVITSNEYSYIRENNSLKVAVNKEDIINVSYMYFKNKDKTYFAFINNKEFINQNCTRIDFEIDPLQTYMFDYEIKESFIEREHQDRFTKENNQITPVYSLEEENLNYGSEYINKSTPVSLKILDSEWLFYYVFTNKKLDKDTNGVLFEDRFIQQGFYLYMFAVPYETTVARHFTVKDFFTGEEITFSSVVNNYINYPTLSNQYINQIIVSKIPPCEYRVIDNKIEFLGIKFHGVDNKLIAIEKRYSASNHFINFKKYYVDNFEEPNKDNLKNLLLEPKLKTYPYNYTKIFYGQNELTIKNEYIKNNVTGLYMYQSFSTEATALCNLGGYAGNYTPNTELQNVDSMHNITNQIPNYIDLITDAWKDYILKNKNARVTGFVVSGANSIIGGAKVATGIMSGNAQQVVSGGMDMLGSVTNVMTQLAKEEDIKNYPNDTKQFTGDICLNNTINGLTVKEITYDIQPIFKQKLFEFFYHYGYKCNQFKVPNLKSRYWFNYIKIADANIYGSFNNDVKRQLKAIYDKGITIWHYHNDFKGIENYEYENAETSLINT